MVEWSLPLFRKIIPFFLSISSKFWGKVFAGTQTISREILFLEKCVEIFFQSIFSDSLGVVNAIAIVALILIWKILF